MIVDNYITIRKDELTGPQWSKLFKRLRYQDDEGKTYEPWRMIPRLDAVRLPRGSWSMLPDTVRYHDKRTFPKMPRLKFIRELDATLDDGRTFSGQMEAVRAMFAQEQGLVIGQPGMGKSQIVLYFAARVKTRVLVLVHTKDILDQWEEYSKASIPNLELGVIQGKRETVGQITIATVQSFRPLIVSDPDKWGKMFGAVILDEAHHAAATTFEQILNLSHARYRLGVTASPTRADKRHPYVQLVLGPIIYKKKFESPVPITVKAVKTDFYAPYRGTWDWGNLVRKLINDPGRNALISRIADAESRNGNSTLVLSRRIEQLERIAEGMQEPVEILTSKHPDRKTLLSNFREGRGPKVVLATQLADEALDVTRLSRILLVHPGKHDGRLVQQIGRALREHPDKEDAVVFDFVDHKVGVLRRQWMQRRQTYKKLKIKIKRG